MKAKLARLHSVYHKHAPTLLGMMDEGDQNHGIAYCACGMFYYVAGEDVEPVCLMGKPDNQHLWGDVIAAQPLYIRRHWRDYQRLAAAAGWDMDDIKLLLANKYGFGSEDLYPAVKTQP